MFYLSLFSFNIANIIVHGFRLFSTDYVMGNHVRRTIYATPYFVGSKKGLLFSHENWPYLPLQDILREW